ncbi:hypothetical protein [Pectobacterium brasiliense]|uniref:hypothetical protein n=1 Tax=Pectobacterium brasiliense TaxID=180957 RepID=UPI0019694665|nr:hypothetical protein [Pectobacterium brasiliense]MBN3262974.1 hypothetical protein [Pectobacterium brasiliense]
MNTPDATERRGVSSDRQPYRRSVRAALAKASCKRWMLRQGWKPEGPRQLAGSVRSMTARSDAHNHHAGRATKARYISMYGIGNTEGNTENRQVPARD